MRILGIDPGTATTGFGIIDADKEHLRLVDFGIIKTSPKLTQADRLNQIAHDIKTIIHERNPEVLAIEKLFFAKNVKTAIKVAEARGVIMQNAKHFELDVHEYSPTEIKTAITSHGQAEKAQIQKMVKLILNLPKIPKPDDAADALATAICHAQQLKINDNNPLQQSLHLAHTQKNQ